MDIDHYAVVLGFNYGEEEASNLSKQDISKAYRLKALELHPDKRPNDPNADANFRNLKTSYEILMDDNARKRLDDSLRVKRQRDITQRQQHHRHGHDAKRRKMMSDLEAREREARERKAKEEEEERTEREFKEQVAKIKELVKSRKRKEARERIARELARTKEEVVRIRSDYVVHIKKTNNLNKRSKVLKVIWEKVGINYTAQRLRELFGEIGKVEDVMIKSYCIKRHNAAIVVMSSEDEALLACQCVEGDLSNPLWIKPTELSPRLSKLVGPQYNAFEDSVLEKLKAKKHVDQKNHYERTKVN